MPQVATLDTNNNSEVLTQAVLKAASEMGFSTAQLGRIIGKDRSLFSRGGTIKPDSKSGELALMLIRAYRSLFVLVGGDKEHIRHWMHTDNHGTQGVPAKQLETVTGLNRVVEYLDSMRGKN